MYKNKKFNDNKKQKINSPQYGTDAVLETRPSDGGGMFLSWHLGVCECGRFHFLL